MMRHHRSLFIALVLLALAAPVAAQPALELTAEDATATAGATATLNMTLENTGDEPSSAILDVTVPDGWSIESHRDGGANWKSSGTKWLFQTVSAEQSRTTGLRLAVPSDASGDYTVETSLQTPDDTTNGSVTVAVTADAGGDGSDGGGGLPGGPMLYVAGAVALIVIVGAAVFAGKKMG